MNPPARVNSPALLAIAHGSPQPRAEPIMRELIARVRSARPDVPAVLAHLGFSRPDVHTAIDDLVTAGVRELVVVPLLLTAAYHVNTDIPQLLRAAEARHPGLRWIVAGALGPHPRLFALVRRRLAEAGAPSDAAVVLGAIGTSDPRANAELAGVAATLGATIGFASGEPDVADVVARLRERGHRPVVVASYVLAPGKLPDRFSETGADIVTEPLGADDEIVAVVLERYDAAVQRLMAISGGGPYRGPG